MPTRRRDHGAPEPTDGPLLTDTGEREAHEPDDGTRRRVPVAVGSNSYSLAETCAPVAWGRGRWPNVAWVDGGLIWFGWERGRIVWRTVRHDAPGLLIHGTADPAGNEGWARAVLGTSATCPPFSDPVVETLRHRLAGLRPFAYGTLFDGLVSSIVGQSISVAAAAVTGARLAALFAPETRFAGRTFWPLPLPEQLASASPSLVRSSGVTWRRAEALVVAGEAFTGGGLVQAVASIDDADGLRRALRSLPLVGPWTAESALLWGIGAPDAYPTKDVALLRAARAAFGRPRMTAKELDRMAEAWRPAQGWAARLLWTALLGIAPMPSVDRA